MFVTIWKQNITIVSLIQKLVITEITVDIRLVFGLFMYTVFI